MEMNILKDNDLYRSLHKTVFGTDDVKVPEIVYLAKNNDNVTFGFISGHWNFDGSFYIEYAGILPEFQKKGYLRYLKQMLFPNVSYITATHNDNAIAQKALLTMGFRVIGCRYDGQFFVEWARRI